MLDLLSLSPPSDTDRRCSDAVWCVSTPTEFRVMTQEAYPCALAYLMALAAGDENEVWLAEDTIDVVSDLLARGLAPLARSYPR